MSRNTATVSDPYQHSVQPAVRDPGPDSAPLSVQKPLRDPTTYDAAARPTALASNESIADRLRASRTLARSVSPERRRDLIRQHQDLVSRKLAGQLSRPDECQLALVRWELDRIRDAEMGPALDFWERLADAQENLATKIESFVEQVEEITTRDQRAKAAASRRR